MSNLPPLETLQCDGDSMSLGLRWDKWLRALEIYLLAAGIDTAAKKRATLLHMGGTALQEIYYNIPGAHILDCDVTDTSDVYKTAIDKLNEYFLPKQSRVYERHLFRLLRQEPSEKFDKFLVRLRQQSRKCFFTNEENNLIDQIIEKCNSVELKKKMLTLGDDITLDKVIAEANAMESVQRQLADFNAQNTMAMIYAVRLETKKCSKCGYIGHYMAQCRTRANKRKLTHRNGSKLPITYKKTKNSLTPFKDEKKSTPSSPANINYIFYLGEDEKIICKIGGVENLELLIDSGSTHNILSDKTWSYLKSRNVIVLQPSFKSG
ncbi:hypothetical protein ACJJTC_005151 [Scirpophaga incertulas]